MGIITTYHSYTNAIRTLGEMVLALDTLDFPEPLFFSEDILERSNGQISIELPQESEDWDFWHSITETVEKYIDQYGEYHASLSDRGSENVHVPEYDTEYVSQTLSAELDAEGDTVATLILEYANVRALTVTAVYRQPGTQEWAVLYAGIMPWCDTDAISIGREIASTELAYLVHKTRSNAAALDYWQSHDQDGWYSQSEWADMRDVNRQTVNDRIRHTRERLDTE